MACGRSSCLEERRLTLEVMRVSTKLKLLVAVAIGFLLAADAALCGSVPGADCMPYGGVAKYTFGSCTGSAPVFAFEGKGDVVVHFLLSIREDQDGSCIESLEGEELGVAGGLSSGYGAHRLSGKGFEFVATPGAPSDQGCLLTAIEGADVVVSAVRVDEGYLDVQLVIEPDEVGR